MNNERKRNNMNIGLNIKKLRISREMTQEELAEYTGVSSRAVSRWENGITYPDITLLPIIANIFEITVDELLDVDVYKKEQDIKRILNQNDEYKHTGEMEKSIALLKVALNKYPNSFDIMEELMHSLVGYYCAKDEDRKPLLNDIIELGEKILNKCDKKEIKESAIQTLVFAYSQNDELDKAKKMIDNQPSIYLSRERLLEHIYKDEELDDLLKHNILKLTEWFNGIILTMSRKKDPQVQIQLKKKYLKFMELVFENKDMGFYHERMYRTYLDIARNYAKMNRIDESIDSLLEGINHAIKLESSHITKYESLLLQGIVDDTSLTQTNTTMTNKDIINNTIDSKYMNVVRESNRFKEVESLLNQLK